VAFSPDIPGANGQGRTEAEARTNLADAIALILEGHCEDALHGVPPKALREEESSPTLDALLSSVTNENLHAGWDTGPAVGGEAW
jgi:predicted RNase H-like HicB family nuclease